MSSRATILTGNVPRAGIAGRAGDIYRAWLVIVGAHGAADLDDDDEKELDARCPVPGNLRRAARNSAMVTVLLHW